MPNRPGRPLALGVARKAFVRELTDAADAFKQARGGRGLPRALTRRAEDSLFRVAAALEEFLTSWMVRSLAGDGLVMRATKQAQAQRKVDLELKNWLEKEVGFDGTPENLGTYAEAVVTLKPNAVPDRPTLVESRRLLRATDDTLTFESAQAYVTLAMTSLAPKFTQRIRRLQPGQRAALDATRLLRNAIAHASARAVTRMNVALHDADMPPELRLPDTENVGRRGIGRYLSQAVTPKTIPRLLYYFEALKEIAYTLEPIKGRRPTLLP